MMSKRLRLAASAQLVASAALVSPTVAHWEPVNCNPITQRACDDEEDQEVIEWSPGEYTVIVDGYECVGENFTWETAFWEDADEEDLDDVKEAVQDECHDWRDGVS